MIIADAPKLVPGLGGTVPVPVEVVPFGWETTAERLAALGPKPELRQGRGRQPFRTDGGNLILDCHFGPIADPAALEARLSADDRRGGDGAVHRHGVYCAGGDAGWGAAAGPDPCALIRGFAVKHTAGRRPSPLHQGSSPAIFRPNGGNRMPDLLETIEDGVATLTLNRPESLNALSDEIRFGLVDTLTRLGADENVGCIVITGAGRGFCAGGDVKSMSDRNARGFESRMAGIQRSGRVPALMHRTPKPIIGMINGVAVGAGLGLATACDIRIAGRSAKFGAAFIKIGLSGDWGTTYGLTRLVGTAKAREMFFTGDMIGAEEAFRLGLVNQVVDDADLLETTMVMARKIAAQPRITLGYTKKNLEAAETLEFQALVDLEAFHQARCSPDRGPQGGDRRLQGKAQARLPGSLKGRTLIRCGS